MRPKTKSCLEDLRTKSIIMVKKRPFEKNEDLMRTHFRAFEDPKSVFSLTCEMVIKKRVFTTLHFLWLMCSCSLWYNCYIYHFAWDACTTRCWWKLLYFSIYGRGTPKIHHNRGKWGLLCKMRTKWGPFQQFGPHEDQVLNWGALRTHCITYYRSPVDQRGYISSGTHSY